MHTTARSQRALVLACRRGNLDLVNSVSKQCDKRFVASTILANLPYLYESIAEKVLGSIEWTEDCAVQTISGLLTPVTA